MTPNGLRVDKRPGITPHPYSVIGVKKREKTDKCHVSRVHLPPPDDGDKATGAQKGFNPSSGREFRTLSSEPLYHLSLTGNQRASALAPKIAAIHSHSHGTFLLCPPPPDSGAVFLTSKSRTQTSNRQVLWPWRARRWPPLPRVWWK